jgi:uncharacterized protein (DUF697 family)
MGGKRKEKHKILALLRPSALAGLRRAYLQVKVDPERYRQYVTRQYRLPIHTWDEMFLLGPEVVNPIAEQTIRSATRIAALEGMGFGMGGVLTILPDMGVLSAITIRLLQKMSLLYGFTYSTDDEVVELWVAAATAAGVDYGKDLIEKQAVERVVPRIIEAMATKMSGEMVEKWSGRIVPLVSAGVGGALNYYFVRGWGRRAQKHFLARHVAERTARGRVLPGERGLLSSGAS